MAHNRAERVREIRRRRAKRQKVLRLRKNYAMAKTDTQRDEVKAKLTLIGANLAEGAEK